MAKLSLPPHVVRAIRSGPVPKVRNWRNLKVKSLTRAERNMKFCESYCVVPEGSLVGQPVKLDIFQQAFFYAVYDNPVSTTEAHLSIARKNSKTATIAMMVLVHLVGPEARLNSEIMSGARSREQASQVYRYASKMVSLSPELREIVRQIPSKKRLVGLPRNTEYTASAAEAATSHGGSPVVAILDELGQVRGPRDDFVDAVITSQGAHDNPLLVAISTQAPTDADMFSLMLDDAAKGEDKSIVSHLYEADADCDIDDREQWQNSNPALGIFRSLADMEKMANKAQRMPSFGNTFRNLYLNQRVNTVSPLIPESSWKACGAVPASMEGAAVWGGLDLSARTDLTALLLVWQVDNVWQVYAHFWAPEQGVRDRSKKDRVPYDLWAEQGFLSLTPGATVDYEYVVTEMAQILSGCEVNAIAYDRWRMDIIKKEMERQGVSFQMEPFGQGYKDMSPAIDNMEAEILNGRMAHGMHPVLTMCASNAVAVRDPTGARKMDKSKATGRIDGMVALAMAMGVAATSEQEPDIDAFLAAPVRT